MVDGFAAPQGRQQIQSLIEAIGPLSGCSEIPKRSVFGLIRIPGSHTQNQTAIRESIEADRFACELRNMSP